MVERSESDPMLNNTSYGSSEEENWRAVALQCALKKLKSPGLDKTLFNLLNSSLHVEGLFRF